MNVQDVGPRDASLMLVGEAPGAEEEACGKPFVGASGKLLRHMLQHAGIRYEDCYVTNVVPTRPPGNNFDTLYADVKRHQPTPWLERCWQDLRCKIESLKPRCCVLLGKESLIAVTGKTKITEWRGTWLRWRDINLLPTYHPAYVLRVYGDHPIVELDLAKARRCTPTAPPVCYTSPSLTTTLDWLHRAMDSTAISLDIETLGQRIRSIGFARLHGALLDAISIPFIKLRESAMASVKPGYKGLLEVTATSGTANSYWCPEDEVLVLDAIDELLLSGIKIYTQNGLSFDLPRLAEEFGLVAANHWLDTMHGWHCIYPEFPKGLDFLCSVLTDYANYWTEHDPSSDASDSLYNCMDCVVTLEAGIKIERELNETVV